MQNNLIVCCKVAKGGKPLIDGSVRKECSFCSEDIWVSPATMGSIGMGLYEGDFACVGCANKKLGIEK